MMMLITFTSLFQWWRNLTFNLHSVLHRYVFKKVRLLSKNPYKKKKTCIGFANCCSLNYFHPALCRTQSADWYSERLNIEKKNVTIPCHWKFTQIYYPSLSATSLDLRTRPLVSLCKRRELEQRLSHKLRWLPQPHPRRQHAACVPNWQSVVKKTSRYFNLLPAYLDSPLQSRAHTPPALPLSNADFPKKSSLCLLKDLTVVASLKLWCCPDFLYHCSMPIYVNKWGETWKVNHLSSSSGPIRFVTASLPGSHSLRLFRGLFHLASCCAPKPWRCCLLDGWARF